jgi:hypothetical protein
MFQTRAIQFINKDEDVHGLSHSWIITNILTTVGLFLSKNRFGKIIC